MQILKLISEKKNTIKMERIIFILFCHDDLFFIRSVFSNGINNYDDNNKIKKGLSLNADSSSGVVIVLFLKLKQIFHLLGLKCNACSFKRLYAYEF